MLLKNDLQKKRDDIQKKVQCIEKKKKWMKLMTKITSEENGSRCEGENIHTIKRVTLKRT